MTAYDPKMANGFREGRASLTSDAVRALSFEQLETQYDGTAHTLWTAMRPRARPSFNPDLLSDFERWQEGIVQAVDSDALPIRYLVLGSRFPGVFSLGGDLDLFAQAIRDRNHDALALYGHRCVRILYRNMRGLERPIITIGLVEGDALGGGFEALLSFHVVIAERGAMRCRAICWPSRCPPQRWPLCSPRPPSATGAPGKRLACPGPVDQATALSRKRLCTATSRSIRFRSPSVSRNAASAQRSTTASSSSSGNGLTARDAS